MFALKVLNYAPCTFDVQVQFSCIATKFGLSNIKEFRLSINNYSLDVNLKFRVCIVFIFAKFIIVYLFSLIEGRSLGVRKVAGSIPSRDIPKVVKRWYK